MPRLELTICGDRSRQEIHSFGASDAWSTKKVGLWGGQAKEAIAQLLFDTDMDEAGRPRGIGLSCWRVLAGAGREAGGGGDADWRSSDTFLRTDWAVRGIEDDTSYDFTRCPGQRWFVHAARRYNVPHFVLFAHAPPAPLTSNGQPIATGELCNLATEHGFRAREFAVYLCKIAAHFERLGIVFAAVSPAHEAHWLCDPSSAEGCPYTNEELGKVAHSLESEMSRRGLSAAVGVPDSGSVDYLTERIAGHEGRSDFLRAYFGDGRLKPTPKLSLITGHSYFSCWPQEDRLISCRERLADAMAPALRNGAQYWMSEYSVYIPVDEPFVPEQVARALAPGGRDDGVDDRAGIDAALWAARVIHCDLVVAGASAWHWWLALSPDGVPDGLIHFGAPGEFSPTKTFYALGHYSLFVRPGMVRVDVGRSDNLVEREVLQGLLASAYVGHGRVVVVCVNMGHADEDVHIGLSQCGDLLPGATYFTSFLTSSTTSLSPYMAFPLGGTVRVPKRSLVTCVGEAVEEGDQFYIIAATSEQGAPLCLEVAQGSPSRCGIVGLGRLAGHAHQLWQFNRGGGGAAAGGSGGREGISLAACHSGFVLDVVNESPVPKAPLHQTVRSPSSGSQLWTMERQATGCVYLCVQHSRHVLEAYGNAARVNVRSGRPEQLWHVVPHDADLGQLRSNPAYAASQAARTTVSAWAGAWVDELPPPMAKVATMRRPASRYAPGAGAAATSAAAAPSSQQHTAAGGGRGGKLRPQQQQQQQHHGRDSATDSEAGVGARGARGRHGSDRRARPGEAASAAGSEAGRLTASANPSETGASDSETRHDAGIHTKLALDMKMKDFTEDFRKRLRNMIAGAAGMSEESIVVEVVGSDSRGLLVEVGFLGIERLERGQMQSILAAATGAPPPPPSPPPPQRGAQDVGSASSSGTEGERPVTAARMSRKHSKR